MRYHAYTIKLQNKWKNALFFKNILETLLRQKSRYNVLFLLCYENTFQLSTSWA